MKTVIKRGEQLQKSAAVISYNDTMGRVNKVNQNIMDNPVIWKNKINITKRF